MDALIRIPRDDEEYSRDRLARILRRRRLNFDPYSVDDERLLELIRNVGWGNQYDIVQMTTVRFTRLRHKDDDRGFDGVYMCVSASDEEIFLHLNPFLYAITAADTLQQTRSIQGKTPIRSADDVRGLVGHTYFVSRFIRGYDINRNTRLAYHLHRLHGRLSRDAATIRHAMTEARIEMLERLLAHPEAEHHLDCRRNLFDIDTPIRGVIESIRGMGR